MVIENPFFRMSKFLAPLLLGLSIAFSPPALSAYSPVSIGVIPPLELPTDNFVVGGARVSLLYGRQKSVYGIDIGGLGNVTYVDFAGVAVSGLFNVTHGMTTVIGLQAAGLSNINTNNTRIVGVQFAGVFNSNSSSLDLFGIQVAAFNFNPRAVIRGLQVGTYNSANSVYGIQIGVLNSANSLHGLQIGLVNFNGSGPMRVFPILNAGL